MTDEQKNRITALRQEGLGYTAIAKQLNLSKDTVKGFCRRNGLAGKRGVVWLPKEDRCRACGRALIQTKGKKHRVFCCEECRIKWWHEHPERINKRAVYSFTCACCGKPFTAYGNSKRKYCSHECYIRNRFKGGGTDG